MPDRYQAVLVLSFGGPEQPEEVIPFLENVLRGKNVPRERMLEVAGHYYHFGGRSPINDQNRDLIAALTAELEQKGPRLPVYWGNRNWHPMLTDTVRQMMKDGIERALVFATSAFSSYSGCRQYLEDIDRTRASIGPGAPVLDKLPAFHNRPEFIATLVSRIGDALRELPPDRRNAARLLFTAHSVPQSMADSSPYVSQLREACELVAAGLGRANDWELAYQSRSGPPSQPWLEPDVLDVLRRIRQEQGEGVDVVLSPIGFISDHMEVLYDLDTEACHLAGELGIRMIRAATPGTHPLFIGMLRTLIAERVSGEVPVSPCPADCCPPPKRPLAGRP